jgi:hypothetical protein
MKIDYISIINKKATIIWYAFGMRGNAMLRILSAHPEVYWNATLQKNSEEFIQHPLELPETVAGFNPIPNHVNDISKWMFSYSTYHTLGGIDNKDINVLINAWVTSNSYKSKKLFLISHPNINKKKLFISDYLLTMDKTPHIWIYGHSNRLNALPCYYSPSNNPQAYNLNIDNLFSTDYITFETEYYSLIAHFNLTSCLNDVRAFILLVLEREQYISKFY